MHAGEAQVEPLADGLVEEAEQRPAHPEADPRGLLKCPEQKKRSKAVAEQRGDVLEEAYAVVLGQRLVVVCRPRYARHGVMHDDDHAGRGVLAAYEEPAVAG
jgi:hypothetical protein